MEHKNLAERLQEWFTLVSALPDWVRTKSPVWVAMRDNLRALGHWRARPRGNPKKGFEMSRKNMNNL